MASMTVRVAAIAALENRFGRVTPANLVEAAKDEGHPLHREFIWDDAKAAYQHRLETARKIISSVRIVTTTETKKIRSVGYVRDPNALSKQQGYVSVARLQTETEVAQEALMAEVTRIAGLLERTRQLAVVLDLEEEMVAALEAIQIFSSCVQAAVERRREAERSQPASEEIRVQ